MSETLEPLRKFLVYHVFRVWRTKAFWMRALLCWMIGAALLLNDELTNYDLRLQIRGPRPAATGVVLVDVSEKDWGDINPDSRNVLRPLKEVMTFTDGFFWNTQTWERLLSRILKDDPAAVGVTFFFGDNIRLPLLSPETRSLFEDHRVVWGADVDSAGRVLVPAFATTYNSNVGIRGVRADDDGTVRRFSSSLVQIPHIGVRLAEIARPGITDYARRNYQAGALINYTGGSETFGVVGFTALMEGRIPASFFRDKVVIIGNLSGVDQVQTPLGRMSRAEVIANIVDNVLAEKTIARAPNTVYFAMLALLMAASLWALSVYPQSVALVFFVMSGILWSAGSAWAFDTLMFWLPVLSPLVMLTVTYIVFLSYQLALNEQRAWRLEQEQKYLSEIEQLKTNFVSMMSHDLKTPIAKIQAICDRLLTASPENPFVSDLKSLRRSSDDLHRYIQSILQVTKVEAKDFKISKEVTDINENIEKVMARLQPLAQEKDLRLNLKLEPMFSIEADTTLIQEVIHNLIENAIKYTPSGGSVTITSEEKDDNVTVVVEDTGPGIAPEEQKEIWGKFTRGRQTNPDVKGTGLGLYLVKYFIELHGGTVFLESAAGQGTRIGFSIPVTEETSAAS